LIDGEIASVLIQKIKDSDNNRNTKVELKNDGVVKIEACNGGKPHFMLSFP